MFFELVGVLILTYGWCVGRYEHPIDQHKVNMSYEFLISCFYYFALSVAAPFSGGHLNPSVTIARAILRVNNNKKYYIIAQIIGALLGSGIGKKSNTKLTPFSKLILSSIGIQSILEL
jgi:glycerol uptake facilitator-like aquaporin